MSLETIGSFIGTLINPLANWLSEKIPGRIDGNGSPVRQVAIKCLAFVLILIPITLLIVALFGMTIFSFQMLYAGI
jgi:predicted PurR-regulated permease PerM